jgi:hypothetical protein
MGLRFKVPDESGVEVTVGVRILGRGGGVEIYASKSGVEESTIAIISIDGTLKLAADPDLEKMGFKVDDESRIMLED